MENTSELACTYAALILADDDIDITGNTFFILQFCLKSRKALLLLGTKIFVEGK